MPGKAPDPRGNAGGESNPNRRRNDSSNYNALAWEQLDLFVDELEEQDNAGTSEQLQ